MRHDGRARLYIAHVPPAVRTGRPLPLVIAFHGGGGEAAGFQAYAGIDTVADREGFIVVYPYGTGPLPRRLLTWNAGDCCGYAMNQRVTDAAFAVAVIDDVARRFPVDRQRVYATGHSNGAMMAYRLAAEHADRIAAIVPVAGAVATASIAPSRAVAVLHIHSVDDPRALYDGGLGPPFPGTNSRSTHRAVMSGLDRWRQVNGCEATPRTVESREGRAGSLNSGQSAALLAWSACRAPVAHWQLRGVGHGWPGNLNPAREEISGPPTTLVGAATEMWRFVAPISLARPFPGGDTLAHPRPSP